MTETDVASFERALAAVLAGGDVAEEAERLLDAMSEDEVLGMLDGDEPYWAAPDGYNRVPYVFSSAPRLGVPGLHFSDGPRGCVMGSATAFPVPMARGASWDPELEHEIGEAIGREVKALGGDFFAGVCVNLLRHPAWGRAQETYGEDPILLGAMGTALSDGVRRYVMACVKHFALNSMENARFSVDVTASEEVLHEVYLPHFRQVVESGVEGVMSAYNAVNGQWCGQNPDLLTGVLRDDWGFEGVVVSDFIFGLRDAVASVRAGLDIEAPYRQLRAHMLPEALREGRIEIELVRQRAATVLCTQLRAAATARPQQVDASIVLSAEHRELARRSAAAGMVLLQNEAVEAAPLLPLDPSRVGSVAVLGALADLPNTGDNGSSNVHSPEVVTALRGLREGLEGITVHQAEDESIEASAAAAAAADVAVVVVGYTAADEGEYLEKDTLAREDLRACFPPLDDQVLEQMTSKGGALAGVDTGFTPFGGSTGGDRRSLTLHPSDEELILAVAAANPRTVVVVVAGSAVIMESWRQAVPGILISWYAGMEGGTALADVLTGRHNPSGRLPFVIPRTVEQLPYFDPEANTIEYDHWHGQRKLDRDGSEAAWPTGFGLSYTRYSLSEPTIGTPDLIAERIPAAVWVRNDGEKSGRHVIQWYARAVEGGDERSAVRTLLGFSAVSVPAGATVNVATDLSTRPLQRYRSGGWSLPAGDYVIEASSYCGDPEAVTVNIVLGAETSAEGASPSGS